MAESWERSSALIEDIEVLRAFAVAFVVVHHVNGNFFVPEGRFLAGFYAHFGGWVGVDLFFAISGFVIARGLLPAMRSAVSAAAAFHVARRFWIRRAFRLLPAAWAWLAIILLLSAVFNRSGVFGGVVANLHATLAGILQYANLRFASTFGTAEYGASFVYWSLSLEWQFYALLPLLAYVLRGYLAWAIGLAILVLFARERWLYGMAFRCDAIGWGVLIALAAQSPAWSRFVTVVRRFPRSAAAGVLGGLGLLGLLGSAHTQGWGARIGMIALVSAVMTAIAAANADGFRALFRARAADVAAWLGSRSYAVYLCHVPAIMLLREIGARLGIELCAWPLASLGVLVGVIALGAELSYRLIEHPWRMRGLEFTSRAGTRTRTLAGDTPGGRADA
jgi:peptidoglycan/LPS O-acetylase OafA/YrhL